MGAYVPSSLSLMLCIGGRPSWPVTIRHYASTMPRALDIKININNDSVSSFKKVDLSHSMFVDCCMHKSREWGPTAAVGRRRAPSSFDAQILFCRNHHLPFLFLPFAATAACPKRAG